MIKTLLDQNYLVVKEFIPQDRAGILGEEFDEFLTNTNATSDDQVKQAPAAYNFTPALELLCEKVYQMSQILEEPLLPTYAYGRVYRQGAILDPHIDRAACEISVTLHLFGQYDWPIFIKRPDNTDASVLLKPGDAMIYLGCDALHWRERFTGDKYAQFFLHYVRSRGPNQKCYFDKVR